MSTGKRTPRGTDELTPKERKFALLYTQGLSQTQAYREAFNKPRLAGNKASANATHVAQRPRVRQYVKMLFREAKKLDLISHAENLAAMFEELEAAKTAENWTAAVQYRRLISQAIGTLSENVTITDERMSDEQLLDRLGSNDPVLAERVRAIVNAKRSFDA